MSYNRCTGIYKFGNNTYPRHIRRRSNLGHIFRGKKCILWAGKYDIYIYTYIYISLRSFFSSRLMKTCNQSAKNCNSVYSYFFKVGKVQGKFMHRQRLLLNFLGCLVVDIYYLLDTRW